jgi:general secretion pathway protein F
VALFEYKAVTLAGEVMEGVMDADSQPAAVARLQAQGYIPIRTENASDKGKAKQGESSAERSSFSLFARKVSEHDLSIVTREIATLLKAGMPLDRAMIKRDCLIAST